MHVLLSIMIQVNRGCNVLAFRDGCYASFFREVCIFIQVRRISISWRTFTYLSLHNSGIYALLYIKALRSLWAHSSSSIYDSYDRSTGKAVAHPSPYLHSLQWPLSRCFDFSLRIRKGTLKHNEESSHNTNICQKVIPEYIDSFLLLTNLKIGASESFARVNGQLLRFLRLDGPL